MAQDRAVSNTLPLTQEFVAMMLAVHRPAVDYRRGRIVVLDRERLEQASCECYALVRGYYRRLLDWPSGA